MNRIVVDISKSRYERLKDNPIFFLKFCEKTQYDDRNGKEIDCSTWCSLDRDLNISFYAGNFANRILGYTLGIVDIDKSKEKKDDKDNVIDDVISMSIHNVSFNNINDWIYIINSFILRSQNKEDKYAFMELLWALDKLPWDKKTLSSAISRYQDQTKLFLMEKIQKFGRILSYYKQQNLEEIYAEHNGKYIIYAPEIITQAYECITNKFYSNAHQNKPNYKNLNFFSIIDAIFEHDDFVNIDDDIVKSNSLLKIRTWFCSESPLDDYSILLHIYPVLPEKYRLISIKRYFHDLRNKHTHFDISFLQKLKENRYDEFIRFRYCIESPAEPIVLTVPLLCDILITLYSTKGQTLQTFDGLLDFVMMHCDIAHPTVELKLEGLMPICNGGAVYNDGAFKGFVDYALIRKLNESLMSADHLRSAFIYLMDKIGRRQMYPVCNYGDEFVIPNEIFEHCLQKRKHYKVDAKGQKIEHKTWSLNCFHYKSYEDRWIIEYKNIENIRGFLKKKDTQFNPDLSLDISLDMLSLDKLKEYIWNIPNKFEVLGNGEFLVHSYKKENVEINFDLYLVQEFSDILRMRIFPQKGAIVGLNFDVFGFWKEIKKTLSEEALQDTKKQQYKEAYAKFEELESHEVRKRCIDSLKKELNSDFLNNSYFEVPFNKSLLSNIMRRFYYKKSFNEKDKEFQPEFLKKYTMHSSFVMFCALELSEEKNPAINLPYVWCMGKECFHNNFCTQTLQEKPNWVNYSLYHMAEIIGFPMLNKTEYGYEPKKFVRQFIAVVNKVMHKFMHLKCRSCGHMMFTDKSSGFNRYNYYACANPTCPELYNVVYLNYCFKCKKGLIDSRDTKRCPNGWYICPTCLACCDDEQYERLAQRYILAKRPVPLRIQEKKGHGHNNRGEYFCFKCGGEIIDVMDEHGNIHKKCKDCGFSYDGQYF